jgi:hypothetical protein
MRVGQFLVTGTILTISLNASAAAVEAALAKAPVTIMVAEVAAAVPILTCKI